MAGTCWNKEGGMLRILQGGHLHQDMYTRSRNLIVSSALYLDLCISLALENFSQLWMIGTQIGIFQIKGNGKDYIREKLLITGCVWQNSIDPSHPGVVYGSSSNKCLRNYGVINKETQRFGIGMLLDQIKVSDRIHFLRTEKHFWWGYWERMGGDYNHEHIFSPCLKGRNAGKIVLSETLLSQKDCTSLSSQHTQNPKSLSYFTTKPKDLLEKKTTLRFGCWNISWGLFLILENV